MSTRNNNINQPQKQASLEMAIREVGSDIATAINRQAEAIEHLDETIKELGEVRYRPGYPNYDILLEDNHLPSAILSELMRLTEALQNINTIKAEGGGEAPVKIWAKGGVEIINPIIASPKKLPKVGKESIADRIKRTFDERRE